MIVQLAVIAVAIFFLFLLDRKPKNYPPGPWGIPFLGAVTSLNTMRYRSALKNMYDTYGKVFSIRFGSKLFVFMADHDTVKTTFSKAETSNRPNFFTLSILAFFKNTGILVSSGEQWNHGRRFALRHLKDLGLGKNSIQNFVHMELSPLIDHFKKNTGKPLEITNELNVAIVSIIWQLTAGKRFSLHDKEMHTFSHQVFETFEFGQSPAAIFNMYPWIENVLPTFVQNLIFGVGKVKKVRQELADYFKKEISEHVESLDVDNPRDYIDQYLIEMNNLKKNPDSSFVFDHEDLESTLFDLFGGGSETTSNSIRWMMLLLALNPEEQRKAQKLIDEAVPRSRLPCLEDRENLVYIDAMICDMLRFSSLAPQGGPHLAAADMVVGGYKVPKGSVLIGCQEIMQRSPIYFEKPDQFYPGHFIGKQGELVTKKGGFLPFGLGRRSCPGESLAKAELFLITTGLLQHFTVSPHPDHPLDVDPHPQRQLFNFPKTFKVVFEERSC